jgi:NAD(P)-dependent dehydrogenase (short-subunit alcohol dehydrogenase family)
MTQSADDVAPVGSPAASRGGLFDIRGRVVIVTGASSGIGAMLAEGLVQQGALVALAARRGELLEKMADTRRETMLPITADVSIPEDRDRIVEQVMARFGRLDGLVNNAGIEDAGPVLGESLDRFERLLEVNLTAPVELAKKSVPHLRASGGGSIVNITSVAAVRTLGNYVPQAAYVASKGGLAAVTRELAVQWGRYGIRVNALAPGYFATDMTAKMDDADGSPPRWFTDRLPIGRLGRDTDLVGTVHYLLAEASSYVTGQHIPLDGGYTLT